MMADPHTNPEGSNTAGDSKGSQGGSRDVLQSTGGEGFVPAGNEEEVQRKPMGKIWGGKFGLLLWKNYLLQWSEMGHFVFEGLVIPLIFITMIWLMTKKGAADAIPLFHILTFISPVAFLCKSIVYEKERKLKESMKMMGLPGWLHWSAWLAKSFILLGIPAALLTLGYKLPMFGVHSEPVFVTDYSLIFLFMMSYLFSSITFAFLVSSFCSKSTSSLTACSVLFFLTFIPYVSVSWEISKVYDELPMSEKLAWSLLSNTAMGFGVEVLKRFEPVGGVQWNTIGNGYMFRIPGHQPDEEYKPPIEREDEFSMLHVIVMLIVDGFLYLFLAVYLEAVFPGEYGVPLPFYFPLMPSYWCGSKRSNGKVHPEDSSLDDTGFFENESEDLNAGIQIKGLRKVFGRKVAVDGLTLNFYENQVTALLGHNGSGKTTTMSMLTGLYPPSSGTALVNGFDIRKDIKSVHGSLGLCPQHDVLFDELTVEEHLKFFCLLKGYALPVQPEIDRMLVALNLESKRNAESQTLSGGMKRKLSVGIALIGGSKVVLLDEPTAGLDPGARRSIWDLISGEKQGRTILLSTHFMDEADLLGDRIAILAQGKAVCCGSSLFLKQKYGGGYHLTMVKEPNCKVNVITELLQKYIPEVAIDQNVGTELSYSLPDKKVSAFSDMFEELEKRKVELGVSSYGCSITKMEEVFMRVGQQVEAEGQLKLAGPTNQSTITGSLQSGEPSSRELGARKSESIPDKRKSKLKIIQQKTPTDMNKELSKSNVPSNQEVILEMNYENESQVKIEDSPPIGNITVRNTGSALRNQQLRAMLVKKWIYTKRNKFTYITLAALPVVLFSLMLFTPRAIQSGDMAELMTFTMSFYAAGFILLPVKEREVNSKHLQLVSGVPFHTFWLSHFLFDMGYHLIICILLTIGPLAVPWKTIGNLKSILAFFLLMFLYGWGVIPMTYLLSLRYTSPSTGFARTAFLYYIVGKIVYYLAFISTFPISVVRFLFRFFPNFNLDYATRRISGSASYAEIDLRKDYEKDTSNWLKDINLFTWGEAYPLPPNEADKYYTDPEIDPGIGQHLFNLFITGLIYIGLLFRIESPSRSQSTNVTDNNREPTRLEDSDVTAENERIRNGNLEELCMSETMVLKNLTHYYWDFVAVDNLCLGVQHGECFGLLGVNGAGKTTTFKMLTGEIGITSGDAYITGKSVESNIKEVHRVMGYCPQFDALIPEMTGRETIKFFARLRGIPEGDINGLAETLAGDLLLLEHLEKPCGSYSGGNKRKLSTAIALIGSPSMVFLDEPTAGMDPVAKRCLWNAIIKVREAGSSIVLTSHSMEESEALCTRLAIMVNGRFRCLGSTQHLKNKFGNGYTLIAQLQASKVEQPERTSKQKRTSLETGRRRQSLNAPPEPWEEYLQPLRNFIEKNFSGCQLKDMHPCYVHYHIPMGSISWAQMFKKMEEAKALFLLEAYSIGQTSLEQVFLGFAKGQYNAHD